MPNIHTEIGSVHSGGVTPFDHEIARAEDQVNKQTETIAHLTAEGHEVTDARKYLNPMLQNLAFLTKLRSSST